MGLDKKDIGMMSISVPIVDYWEMKEEIDRLSDCVNRLEKIVEVLVALYCKERVKNWELELKEMLNSKEVKKEGKIFIKPVFTPDTSEVEGWRKNSEVDNYEKKENETGTMVR